MKMNESVANGAEDQTEGSKKGFKDSNVEHWQVKGFIWSWNLAFKESLMEEKVSLKYVLLWIFLMGWMKIDLIFSICISLNYLGH